MYVKVGVIPVVIVQLWLMGRTENDTLARIGTSCLQQLLEKNTGQLDSARWERVARTFVDLFKITTPYQLFDESLRVEIDGTSSEMSEPPGACRVIQLKHLKLTHVVQNRTASLSCPRL